MSEKNTGGPAFPRPYSHDGFNDETCLAQSGMTLRDYFIAHAPDNPQPWFEPAMPPKPSCNMATSTDEELTRTVFAVDEWLKEREKQRFIQWPGAWADAQLKARAE